MLDRLSEEPGFEPFKEDYEKLLEALEKSHDSERKLESKCRELNAELVSNAARVQSALQVCVCVCVGGLSVCNSTAGVERGCDRRAAGLLPFFPFALNGAIFFP